MQKLSDGTDSTLARYLEIAQLLGLEGGAELIRRKIAESPHGEAEEVLAPESQMMTLLASL